MAKRGRRPKSWVRTNITIPRALKERLDKIGGDLNWSDICSKALERAADELEQMPPKLTLEERLTKLEQKVFGHG